MLPVCGNFNLEGHLHIEQILVFTHEERYPLFGGFQLKLQGLNSCLQKTLEVFMLSYLCLNFFLRSYFVCRPKHICLTWSSSSSFLYFS